MSCHAFGEKLRIYVTFAIVKLSLNNKKTIYENIIFNRVGLDGSVNLLETQVVLIDGERISSIASIGEFAVKSILFIEERLVQSPVY